MKIKIFYDKAFHKKLIDLSESSRKEDKIMYAGYSILFTKETLAFYRYMNKGKVKLYSFDNEKERVLKNHPEIRDIYDSLELKYKFIEALIEYGMKNHLTQRELAKKNRPNSAENISNRIWKG
ncbi:hypothetical protein [Athalassotoga saccharophila]|uniref:hypothetical protein n=1 Tax=Athalassotoga saccharophila TaxID=1441386 RepID=UPI001379A0B8|nr:hypothetical protein [Athalassotoga saccharophila]BBJ27390.1 hypothetical protein ATHSA_0258 [Athalassotoga saccharophila]